MENIIATIAKEPEKNQTALAVATPFDLPVETFSAGLARRGENRRALLEWIKQALVDGVDFGAVQTKRGMSRPSLRKPGAEKICGMLGMAAQFPTLPDYEQAAIDGKEIKTIILRCMLTDSAGMIQAEGAGARNVAQDCGDINKALKMAEKSAHIDAVLRLAGLSEIFTQDIEDMIQAGTDPALPNPPKEEQTQTTRLSGKRHKALEASIAALVPSKDRTEFRDRVKAWVFKQWRVEHLTDLSPAQNQTLKEKLPAFAGGFLKEKKAKPQKHSEAILKAMQQDEQQQAREYEAAAIAAAAETAAEAPKTYAQRRG